MCLDNLSCSVASIALSLAWIFPCAGQTYWATSPAIPGPAGTRESAERSQVRSLPPPPQRALSASVPPASAGLPSGEAARRSEQTATRPPDLAGGPAVTPHAPVVQPFPDRQDAASRSAGVEPASSNRSLAGPALPPIPLLGSELNNLPPPASRPGSAPRPGTGGLALPPPPRLDRLDSDQGPSLTSVPAQMVSSIRPSVSGPASVPPPDRSRGGSTEFNAARLIAVVGTEHVLAGDLAGFVEPIIEANRDRFPDKRTEDQVRQQLTRQVLKQYIVIKALFQEFFHDTAGNAAPEEIEAMKKQVGTRASKIFHERQVPALMKQNGVNSLRDLELKLREKSMSLATMKRQFIEQAIAQELERKYVPNEFEVSLDELWNYYQSHSQEWFVPAKARWRQLTIRFDRHASRAEVEQRIKELGNQVYLGGLPFEAAARQYSEGYTADQGGVYDWTRKGSLKSQPLDAAIFSIPLGRLSQVIEDDVGMHIIEVLERVPEHHTPFEEAQAEIRRKLSEEKRSKALQEFHKKVLGRTPVWSLWPEDLQAICPHVRPLAEAGGH